MAATNDSGPRDGMWIEIEADGPYTIHGDVPLVRKAQVVLYAGVTISMSREPGGRRASGETASGRRPR